MMMEVSFPFAVLFLFLLTTCSSFQRYTVSQWNKPAITLLTRSAAKRPKVADSGATLPDPLPLWMKKVQSDYIFAEEELILKGPPFTCTILNEAPVWVEFCAMTFPQAGRVQPATGFLAPQGGANNLCNEEERYADSCQFVVQDFVNVEFLVIATEESVWKYRLVSEMEVV